MAKAINEALYQVLREPVKYLRYTLITFITNLGKPTSLNIGGGPNFYSFGWINFDEVKSKMNPSPFQLTPNCVFPLKDRSLKIIYTSHCLEHLDTPTVTRVLKESHRVLKHDGKFIIKIPDFDEILKRWKMKDLNYFDNRWDYKSIVHTWKNRGISDCLDYRAATIFCGFWNEEYGNHYSQQFRKSESAYHGPPIVEIEFLQNLMNNYTPSQISAKLRRIVLKNEKNFKFNHQNAWSRQELDKLLNSFGFRVRTFSKELILKRWGDIPTITNMSELSMYCWAEPISKYK